MKVMILDDDPLILSLLVNIFHRRGYEVVTYSDPTLCPLYSRKAHPDHEDEMCPSVIISDYDMPFVNGVEFIETLRKNGCKCPHMALVSGSFPEPDNLDRIARLGVKFFAKPLHRNQITGWLDQIEPSLQSRSKPYP